MALETHEKVKKQIEVLTQKEIEGKIEDYEVSELEILKKAFDDYNKLINS